MKFENVTIELNGITEIVFNRTTVWTRKGERYLKYKIKDSGNQEESPIAASIAYGTPIGGMSVQEMHDILEHHMQDVRKYSVSVSGTTINIKREKRPKPKNSAP